MRKVEFKFDTYARVKTPLTDRGIVTMLGYQDGITKYYVESADNGVENTWWREALLEKSETKPDV